MVKVYPVRMFYFRNRSSDKVWSGDKYDIAEKARAYAMLHMIARTEIYEIQFPRTLNSEAAFWMVTGQFGKFRTELYRVINLTFAPPPPPSPTHLQAALDLLGLDRATITKELLQKAFRQAAMNSHPDRQGGSEKRMQAVNAAHVTIKKECGW